MGTIPRATKKEDTLFLAQLTKKILDWTSEISAMAHDDRNEYVFLLLARLITLSREFKRIIRDDIEDFHRPADENFNAAQANNSSNLLEQNFA